MDEKKKIEVVTGNGSDLDISPVYQHIEVEKPKEEIKKENIVIPEEKNNVKGGIAFDIFLEFFMLSIFS